MLDVLVTTPLHLTAPLTHSIGHASMQPFPPCPAPFMPLQSSCYDACRDCRECMDAVAGLPARLASLNGDTSKYAAAASEFCFKVGCKGGEGECVVLFGQVHSVHGKPCASLERVMCLRCINTVPEPTVFCALPCRMVATTGRASWLSAQSQHTPRLPLAPQLCARHCTSAGERAGWCRHENCSTFSSPPDPPPCPPGALCSDACVGALDLQLCSTDGHASGAVPASVPPAGTCTSSAACTTAQTCDTSSCTKLTQVRSIAACRGASWSRVCLVRD